MKGKANRVRSSAPEPAPYVWLLAFVWIEIVAGLSIFPSISDDVYFYLQLGRMKWETGRFPATDPFLFSLSSYAWHLEHEWLSYIVFYAVFRVAGFAGLVLFKTTLILIPVLLLFLLCRQQGAQKLCAISAILLLALFAGADRLLERASLFSDALLLVVLLLLYFNSRRPSATLLIIPALFLLWVNLHPGFILGLAVLWIFIADAAIIHRTNPQDTTRRLLLRWIAVGALSIAACFANPLGAKGFFYPLRLTLAPEWNLFRQFNTEWKPTWRFFPSYETLWFSPLTLLGAAVAFWPRSRAGWRDRLLLLLFAGLGWSGIRFVLPSAMALVVVLSQVLSRSEPWRWKKGAYLAIGTCAALTIIVAKLLVFGYRPSTGPRMFGLGENRIINPHCLADFIDRHQLQSLRIFNEHDLGAFFIYRFNGAMKVYFHGFVTDMDFYRDNFLGPIQSRKELDRIISQFRLQGFILKRPFDRQLLNWVQLQLELSREWDLVYWDDYFVLYVKKTALEPPLKNWAYRYAPLRMDRADRPSLIAELKRARNECPSHREAKLILQALGVPD